MLIQHTLKIEMSISTKINIVSMSPCYSSHTEALPTGDFLILWGTGPNRAPAQSGIL